MKRVKITSQTARTHVNLTYPTVDPNKQYTITVEKLTVPVLNSLVMNEALFTVERRLAAGVTTDKTNIDLGVPATFTPKSVRNVSHLLYQMNMFFRELMLRLVTTNIPHNNAIHQYTIPNNFLQQAGVDWYSGVVDPGELIATAISATFRTDGRIGIYFREDASKLFVLHLTEVGKRIFGTSQDWLGANAAGQFHQAPFYSHADNPYVPPAPISVTVSACPLPLDVADYEDVAPDSLFSHMQYRHELVITTSLPLENTVECDQNRSFYRRQLASYRFPTSEPSMQYGTTRKLMEVTETLTTFENNLTTHNRFILTGSDLQNFNMYLKVRRYELKDGLYVQTEDDYPIEGSYFMVQLALFPI